MDWRKTVTNLWASPRGIGRKTCFNFEASHRAFNLDYRVKAGALQFVLFIGAIVALLLMAFVLLSHTHSLFDKKTDLLVAMVKSTDLALEASFDKPIPLGESITIEHQNEVESEIFVQRELWGIFEKRTITSFHGKTRYIKTVLVGAKDDGEMPALYVEDKQRPVVLAGSAKITGNAFLPNQGLKMGNINGNGYRESKLLYGKQETSDSILPALGEEILNHIQLLTHINYEPEGEITPLPNKELKNSFQAPTLVIRDRIVNLENVELSGNIIVSATERIIVEPTAVLRDVLLIAPEINIKSSVRGYFQALASEHISVEKYCRLSYPTVLLVNKKSNSDESNKNTSGAASIFLDSYSELNGVLISLQEEKGQVYAPQIKINENARVQGEVYCSGNLELKGMVDGNVTTSSFIAMENGSIYQNHLYQGVINSGNLSRAYVGLFRADRNTSKMMKWLY